jgi:alpha-amylase
MPIQNRVMMQYFHGYLEVGRANTRFVDLTEHVREAVITNEAGWGELRCPGGSVSVWVQE